MQMLNMEKFVVQELQVPKKQMENVRDDLRKDIKLMNAEHKKHHDETSCEMAILRQAARTSEGKVDIGLTNNQKHLKKVVDELTFKINSGQEEILSQIKELASADTVTRGQGQDAEIVNVKDSVNKLEDVMTSFDKHLTDVKEEVKIIPVLFKTMLEIVRALNATFGEEVVREPHPPNKEDKHDESDEGKEKPVKQRAARRTKK